jgi:peptide/nickel transport system substrate-binding protein
VDKNRETYLANHYVGTGPLELTDWRRGDRQIYKKFADYWKKGSDGQPLPYLDGVELRYIPDFSVAVLEMRTGNISLV